MGNNISTIGDISDIDLKIRQTWVCLGCYNKNIAETELCFVEEYKIVLYST